MLIEAGMLVLGFVLLIVGADVFVKSSVSIAKRLHIPSVVIGLTVVALGTSAPEAVISATAAAQGSNGLAISNAIGSNMFNLLLIVGICAIIRPIVVKFKEISRDFWAATGAAGLLLLLAAVSGDSIPWFVSLLLLLIFIAYMVILVRQTLKGRDETAAAVTGGKLPEENGTAQKPLPVSILLAILGCGMIVAGGQFAVGGASDLAVRFGISQRVIGLTVVAVGTSLPELVVSLVACKKGEGEVALGNVVGSSIFNILFVLGIAGLISPLPVDINVIFDLIILTAGSIMSLLFAYTSQKIVRVEGAAMVLMYFSYMLYTVFR